MGRVRKRRRQILSLLGSLVPHVVLLGKRTACLVSGEQVAVPIVTGMDELTPYLRSSMWPLL